VQQAEVAAAAILSVILRREATKAFLGKHERTRCLLPPLSSRASTSTSPSLLVIICLIPSLFLSP
jgi:hypothetical protein